MEYMQLGSLYDIIHKTKANWNELLQLRILLQIAEGLKVIHDRNVIHRDLKSMNVLV